MAQGFLKLPIELRDFPLTPWFPPDVKPVRIGMYIASTIVTESPFYRYWDGENWHCGDSKLDFAFAGRGRIWPHKIKRPIYWRGLAVDPNA